MVLLHSFPRDGIILIFNIKTEIVSLVTFATKKETVTGFDSVHFPISHPAFSANIKLTAIPGIRLFIHIENCTVSESRSSGNCVQLMS